MPADADTAQLTAKLILGAIGAGFRKVETESKTSKLSTEEIYGYMADALWEYTDAMASGAIHCVDYPGPGNGRKKLDPSNGTWGADC